MIKPIAMRCNKQQYEEIRDVLLKNEFTEDDWIKKEDFGYLTNNFNREEKLLSYTILNTHFRRISLNEWNKDVFLEYCGIETFPEKWCIKQSAAQHVCDWFNQKYSMESFLEGCYTYLVYTKDKDSNYSFNIPKEYKEISVEEFDKHILKKEKTMQKLTVPITDVIRIHASINNTCDWKKKVADYLSRVDVNQMITFTQDEIDAGFEAANSEQTIILKEVFGEKPKFKVGDIVVVTKRLNDNKADVGQILKLIEIHENSNSVPYNCKDVFNLYKWKYSDNSWARDVRLATEEEIADATKPIIDYDKLKTGSVVKLKDLHCSS